MIKQAEGLKYNPRLMLIDDADRPAKWYFGLKQNLLESRRNGDTDDSPDGWTRNAALEELSGESHRWGGLLQLVEVKLDAYVLAIRSEDVDFGVVGRHIAGVVLDPDPGPDQAARSAITIR